MNTGTSRTAQFQHNSQAAFFEEFSDEDCNNVPNNYNGRLDDYFGDPEDDIRFPPEIFDTSDY